MKSFWKKALLLGGCILVAAALNYWLNPGVAGLGDAPGNQLSVEAAQAYGNRILWVDARSADAYGKGHIPGAINLTMAAFDDQLGDVLDLWTPESVVIVYCDSGNCGSSAEVAARLAKDMGEGPQANIFVLNGGWQAWQQANPAK